MQLSQLDGYIGSCGTFTHRPICTFTVSLSKIQYNTIHIKFSTNKQSWKSYFMLEEGRQRVPQKWASKEIRDCTRAVTNFGQRKREKRLTPCYRLCAYIWLTKSRKLICWESTCERVRASVSENKQFIVHSVFVGTTHNQRERITQSQGQQFFKRH